MEENNLSKKVNHKNEKEISDSKKAATFFQLQYSLLKRFDYIVIVFAMIGSLATGIAMPLFSIVFGGTINTFGAGETMNPDKFIEDIRSLCLKFLWVGLGMFAAGFIMIWLWNYNGRIIAKRVKKNYFKLLMQQEQGYFDQKDTFEFATKIQSQVKAIEMGLGEKIGNSLMSATMAVSSFIVGFMYSLKLSLVLFSVMPLIILGGYFMIRTMRLASIKNRKAYEKAGGIAEEVIFQIKTVASFANYEYEIERFDIRLQESLQAGLNGAIKSSIITGSLFFLIFASYTLAIWFGSKLIYEQEYNSNTGKAFQAGDVLTVLFTIVFGALSLGQAAPNLKAIAEAMNSAYDFFELQKRTPLINKRVENENPDKEMIQGRIEFRKVNFSYPAKPEKKILDDLNIVMESGKVTALVGPSGCGKSTIVNLIERLYELSEGSIILDNYDISKLDVNYLRTLIGYVPQEPVLFNTSIRDNIIFGRENISDEQVWIACKKAYADEFIIKMEEGLDYVVGLKGSKLSGGQKQRIAIARAILTQPKILILDEATSALDNRSEKEVQIALNKVSKGVTTIIIAHRLSTIMNADKIIVLKSGVALEEGTHKNLLEQNGIYAGLIRSQVGTQDYKADLVGENQYPDNDEYKDLRQQTTTENNNEYVPINSVFIPRSKLQRKTSLEELQEKIELEHKKKKELENLANEKKKKLWPILCRHVGVIVSAAFFASCVGTVWPVYGILLADSIDSLSKPNLDDVKQEGFMLAMYFLILAGVAGITNYLQNYLFTSIGENLTKDMRKLTFIKYLRLHMGFYDIPTNTPGTLTTQLASDTTKINGIALSMVGISVQTLATLVVAIVLGFIFDYRMSLINIAFLPLTIGGSVMEFRLQNGFASVDEIIESTAGGIVSESVCNTKTIYCYNMQGKVVRMYSRVLKNGMKTINKTSFVIGFTYGFCQLSMFATYSALFYAGGSFIYQGTLTIKAMFRAIFVLLFAGFGLGQAQQYVGDMAQARQALVNLFKNLDEPSLIDPIEIKEKSNPPALKPEKIYGEIEFKNVCFSYPTRSEVVVFENLNFKILPGQNVAFVGFSGSGKSTIIQLIERFYDVTGGEILIDGKNIKDYDLITLRHNISLVMQEPVLFKTDIVENIRYGKLNATFEEVKIAAEKAKISQYVSTEYDNSIIPVSGGEKQRIAIARAIIKNPSILLLDEATSALDSGVEKEIQKTLDELLVNRTTITIAHRLSTVEKCDRIFMMEDGKIVEQGVHHELYEMKGKYFNLYNAGNAEIKKLEELRKN